MDKNLKIKDKENSSLHKAPTELPRYFTRSKRRREEDIDQENERYHKIARAFLSSSLADEFDADKNVADHSFPADVIAGIRIPKTYSEAINDPVHSKKWKDAMLQEIIGLSENGTWKEVIPPKNVNLVSTKWVYTIKLNTDGSIERFKARLVARGFSQIHGIDYTETFAPTVRMDTLRLFLARVAKENLECYHYDIKNAFTESNLKEEIYLSPPKGVPVTKGYVKSYA